MHCRSSSGRRDPRELSTAEAKAVIDELERMPVFYVNIGGGEPTLRPDFWELHPLPAQQRELYDWLVARGEVAVPGGLVHRQRIEPFDHRRRSSAYQMASSVSWVRVKPALSSTRCDGTLSLAVSATMRTAAGCRAAYPTSARSASVA